MKKSNRIDTFTEQMAHSMSELRSIMSGGRHQRQIGVLTRGQFKSPHHRPTTQSA